MSSQDQQDPEQTVVIPFIPPGPVKAIGPYEVIKLLGEGGMGQVFLCSDSRNPNAPPVAVKTVFPELLAESATIKRFEAEARALASVRHQGVVKFYECGVFETAGRTSHYMAMEYIDGISLYVLSRQRRLSFPDIMVIAIQIARGLDAIHSGAVIHRDLKPGNIMVTKDGLAKIIDFGIAKPSLVGMSNDEAPTRGFKTQTGMFIGTVNYVAPEILRDKPASPSSDIYALGLIIWEMLNGATPFKSDNIAETIKRVTSETLAWPTLVRSLAPLGFLEFVDKILAKDPAARPIDASTVAVSLEKIATAARWTGSLARKTRFDLNIFWSTETISQIKNFDISEPEVTYVLQEIEDQLTSLQDSRLQSTKPITVSSELIAKCVSAYRRTRFETSKRRMTRPQPIASTGTVPFKLVTSETSISPTRTSFLSFRAVVAAVIIASSVTYFGFSRNPEQMVIITAEVARLTRSLMLPPEVARDLAGSASAPLPPVTIVDAVKPTTILQPAKVVEPETRPVVLGDTVKPLPATKLATGRVLSYRVTTPSADGKISVSQHTRFLTEISSTELTWLVDGTDTLRTPRSFLTVEAYFNPMFRKRDGVLKQELPEISFFPLTAGVGGRIRLADTDWKSAETVECTPISSRYTTVQSEQHEVWKVECFREVTFEHQLVYKIVETYQYSPSLEAVLEVDLRATRYDPKGTVISTTTSQFDLQPHLSVF